MMKKKPKTTLKLWEKSFLLTFYPSQHRIRNLVGVSV